MKLTKLIHALGDPCGKLDEVSEQKRLELVDHFSTCGAANFLGEPIPKPARPAKEVSEIEGEKAAREERREPAALGGVLAPVEGEDDVFAEDEAERREDVCGRDGVVAQARVDEGVVGDDRRVEVAQDLCAVDGAVEAGVALAEARAVGGDVAGKADGGDAPEDRGLLRERARRGGPRRFCGRVWL